MGGPMGAKSFLEAKAGILLLVACSTGAPSGARAGQPNPGTPEVHAGEMLFVEANNSFTIDLFQRLSLDHKSENVFVSPYSISQVLLMAAEGARHETAAEMGRVLRFPTSLGSGNDTDPIPWAMAPLHEGLAQLNARFRTTASGEDKGIREEIARLQAEQKQIDDQLKKSSPGSETLKVYLRKQEVVARLNELRAQLEQNEVRIANALWCEQTYPLRSEFIETIDRYYAPGGVFEVDFKFDHEDSRHQINKWVEEQTRLRIKDLIGPGVLNASTRLVLTNAIYFKGEWSEPFRVEETKQRNFFLADGDSSMTLMMEANSLGTARYAAFEADGSFFDTPNYWHPPDKDQASKAINYPSEEGFAVLELPYKGDRISMVLISPNHPDGLPEVERMLTVEGPQRWTRQLKARKVHVRMPKFRLETVYSMTEVLQGMGMVRAFEDPRFPNGSQFGGITSSTDPNEQPVISAVLHKAMVEVNEQGTEAAAATATTIMITSGLHSTPFVPMFRADRPFVFMIQDRPTGAILFIGRMLRPDRV